LGFVRSQGQFWLYAAVIVALNVAFSFVHWDVDLTTDGRFTMNEATYKLVDEIDETITVEIYLEGKLPAALKELQDKTRELLERFRRRNELIEYVFIDPYANVEGGDTSAATKGAPTTYIKALEQKMKFLRRPVRKLEIAIDNDGVREQYSIMPAAVVRKGTQEQIIDLMEYVPGVDVDYSRVEYITPSVNMLEYKFANAIQKLMLRQRKRIAFLTGHGEMAFPHTQSLWAELREHHDVAYVNLDSTLRVDTLFDILFVVRPLQPLGERHQFLIDQYIMQGGNVVWAIDPLEVDMDSLAKMGVWMPYERRLDVMSLLFNYGARINSNLIADLTCSQLPVIVGDAGGQPQIKLRPWLYHVRAFPYSRPEEREQGTAIQHPIVRNLDYVDTRYPSSIDTVKTRTAVQKTPLLRSSRYSKVQFPPLEININMAKANIGQEAFPPNKGYQNIAMLLEGEFESHFRNRISPEMERSFREAGREILLKSRRPSKMIIISDADILRGEVIRGEMPPIGFNKFENYQYGNRDFVLNCVEYLLDNKGILAARNKELKMRVLDRERFFEEKQQWWFINLLLPLTLLAIFGFGYNWLRLRRYART